MSELIPDCRVQEAFDWLRENADAAAEAKAHRIYLEEYRKTLKAKIMKEHEEESLGAQEREAYASKRYEEHLAGLELAIARDEKFRWRSVTELALVTAWQTASKNERSGL